MTQRTEYLSQLISFSQEVQWSRLPAEAQNAARYFLADTVGVGLAACQLPDVQRQRRLALDWGAGEVGALGGSGQWSAAQAAFINGLQIHCQEFDAVHERAVVHAASAVLAACLADCGRQPHSGQALLEALVVGVEAAVGLGIASRAPMRFFRPATAGQMGAVLALCQLNGLGAEKAVQAMGLAFSQIGGTMQAHLEGSPALAYQLGFAARNAVVAYDMAAAGSRGPADCIEGPYGYMAVIEDTWDLRGSCERLHQQWAIAELACKPYPTGRASHGILAMLEAVLIEHPNLAIASIRRIEASVPPLIKRLVGRPPAGRLTLSQARLCLPFLVATRLLRGPIGLDSFAAEWLRDPSWSALAGRVNIVDDGNADPNALNPQTLRIDLTEGQPIRRESTVTFGAPEKPLDETQLFEKFSACLDFGQIDLGPGREAQWASLLSLSEAKPEKATDVIAAFLRQF